METVPVAEPRVARFERLGFGMFIHWGLYAQLGKGEWIRHLGPVPGEEVYDALMEKFGAEEFDARQIARVAKGAGMKYITLTSRHHDGFSLYDTRGLSQYDAPHAACGRDLALEFVEGCRSEGIVPFFYHTTLDWRKGSHTCTDAEFEKYLDYLHASVEVLCTHYGPLGGIWFDGDWSRPTADWKHDRLYGMIRRLQPEAMIINNTGLHEPGKVGHAEIDSVTFEQSMPKPLDRRGHAKYVAGEMCQTLNAHWGIGTRDFNFKSPAQAIEFLASSRKVGANYLLNVGPTAAGAIPELEKAILAKVGEWVGLFGELIYEGKPVAVQCQGRDFVLAMAGAWYYFAFDLAVSGHGNVTAGLGGAGPRTLKGVGKGVKQAVWVDNGEVLQVAQEGALVAIDLTGYPYGSNLVVRVARIGF